MPKAQSLPPSAPNDTTWRFPTPLLPGGLLSAGAGEAPAELRTRVDLAQFMRDLYEPLRPHQVADGFDLGLSATLYSAETARCEAFLRPLWGLVPLAAGGGSFAHWAEWRQTLIAGTDPTSPAFWGLITAQDQLAVEMAPVATGLLLAPHELWEPLTPAQRVHLVTWLRSIEHCTGINNNWLFFRILVHLAFDRLGETFDRNLHATDLAAIDRLYLGDGWYSDGPAKQRDYYIPMAIHYYGLLYARLAADRDPERCVRFRAHAALFAKDFTHWFTPTGDAVPFGRSLSYRFAQGAFWSAIAYAGVEVEGLSRGQIKGLLMRHLRWWLRQPIFTHDGLLSIGYTYPNLLMSEPYNAPGSPYWATKAFLVLALPAADPFWQAIEEPLPARTAISVQPHAGLIFQHDDARAHTTVLASGQFAGFMPSTSSNKYGKFAYSSAFGFAALGVDDGVGGGGFDSTLALSEDGRHFRSREACVAVAVRGETLASCWQPWADVTVETWLAPVGLGHVRIHHVVTPRPLTVCDSGFSLPTSRENLGDLADGDSLILRQSFGVSGIRDLSHGANLASLSVRPNLNLLHPRTRMPGATWKLPAGAHWFATAVVGIPDAQGATEIQACWHDLEWQPATIPAIVRRGEIVLRAEPIPEHSHLTPVSP